MFEFEVDHATFPASTLPPAIRDRFAESRATVRALSILPWEEHCTECAMPQCYTSCDLYQPRKDGKCRRFMEGCAYVGDVPGILGYVARIRFKRWGALLAYAHLHLRPVASASALFKRTAAIDRIIARVPDGDLSILGRRGITSRIQRRVKQRIAHGQKKDSEGGQPDCFLAEIYNPQQQAVELSLVMRDHEGPLRERPYQELLRVEPGFNRFRLPFASIEPHLDRSRQFLISLCPNINDPADEGITLYMGLLAFVKEAISAGAKEYEPGLLAPKQKYVKVVAWDLDNTLWDGILVEDGEEKLRLKPGIAEVIKELDRRGIVNSVVSKNDFGTAMSVLQRFGLVDYFVFPKISWEPKSEAVMELVEAFNVGADTVAVVDDSLFERAEIEERCQGVRLYADDLYDQLLERPEFRPALSPDSSRRREFYRAEERRREQKKSFAGDYLSFLRSCRIEIQVRRTTRDNVARTHELIQRTNQLNFSGNRYSREQVEQLIAAEHLLPMSIHCKDRFGDYGLVGFSILNTRTWSVDDLMFSCRVQAKQVEHAFLTHLLGVLQSRGMAKLDALYKRTEKNARTAKVFDDLGFTLAEVDDKNVVHRYTFDLSKGAPRQDVVMVDWEVHHEFPAGNAAGVQDKMVSGS